MALKEILGQVLYDHVLRNLGGTSAAHPVVNFQICYARVGYWVNTGKYTPSRAGGIFSSTLSVELGVNWKI